MATALAAGVLALVLFPLVASPTAAAEPGGAPRAIQPFTLDMVEGGGILQLRDADPYAIETPTSISGSYDTGDGGTGAISGATFSTPRVSFEQDITDPVEATVFIDADFAQVSPSSGTGSIDHEGNVLFQTALRVDLHIEVIGLTADCTSSPINLTFASTAPYDLTTQRVTLRAPNFTVPPAPIGSSIGCSPLIGGAVNEQLAGSGHSLELTVQGPLELPPAPGCDTVSELAVAPGGGSRLGDEVSFAASVALAPDAADDPDCAERLAGLPPDPDPGGFVEFRDGSTIVETVPLVAGEATFATGSLPAGNRNLSVRYRGEPPFNASTSAPITYLVAATPAIVTTFPEFLPIGVATPFEVELDNNGLGFDVIDARLDVSLERIGGSAAWTPALVLLEYHDGTDWQTVSLATAATRRLLGSVGDPFAFSADQNRTIQMRITPQPNPTPALIPGPLAVTFELIEVDPDSNLPAPVLAPAPGAVTSTALAATLLEGTRRPSSVALRQPLLGPAIQPGLARQGYTTVINTTLNISGATSTGSVQVLIDGRPVPARRISSPATPLAEGFVDRVPLFGPGGIGSLAFVVPPDLAPGPHAAQVRFLGDAAFLPSISPEATFTVVGALDPMFECQSPVPLVPARFTTLVRAEGAIPTYARAGSSVPVTLFGVDMAYDRGPAGVHLSSTFGTGEVAVGSGRLAGIRFGFGSLGEGTATSLTRTGTQLILPPGTALNPPSPDPTNPDATISFGGESASLSINGAPGEVVPVALHSISIDYSEAPGNPASTFFCTPVGDPVELGRVTIAGTTLAVSPDTGVRVGDEVTLSAAVAPAGVPGNVVFSDNGTTVGVVPVAADGTASITITAHLGTRTLKARFFGGTGVLSSEDEQTLTVVATDCAPFAEPGSAAVVRLVYLELLRRCPDQAGFDFWTGRLDGGTSQEVFARSIAYTPEARGVVVDDAYQLMLGRAPDGPGRAFWVQRLGANGRYDALLADLGSSDEFWQAAGATNEGFVQRVYDRLLQRPADGPGLAYWVGRLDAGVSRRVLITTLFNLDEPLGQVVRSSYEEILDRAPDATERTTAITRLRGDSDRSGLYASLIGRPEFNQRAQSFPNLG